MKNIHLFETKNAFDKAKSGLILPRVSYITENQDVKYNPTFDANGHDFVEINGIKWATMNVGASGVTDYGKYFQWGDTQGYTQQDIKNGNKEFSNLYYKSELITKYNSTDKNRVLDLKDDAVHAAWGGSWRMPRTDEIAKLSVAVTTEFVKNYNNSEVNGLLCTATDGSNKTLFFPACSKAMNETVVDIGIKGSYWYSSLNSGNVSQAYGLYFRNSSPNWQSPYYRDAGLAVRGVLGEI